LVATSSSAEVEGLPSRGWVNLRIDRLSRAEVRAAGVGPPVRGLPNLLGSLTEHNVNEEEVA
jgi:hypothetical protein